MGLSSTLDSTRLNYNPHVRHFYALISKIILVLFSFIFLFSLCSRSFAAYDPEHKFFYKGYSFATSQEWDRAYYEFKTLGTINGQRSLERPPINYRMIQADSQAVVTRLTESEVNSAAFRASVVPTASNLGSVMRKRMFAASGAGLLGVAAVEGLLEGIGWIMDPAAQSIWRNKTEADPNPSCDSLIKYYGSESLQGNTCRYTGQTTTTRDGDFPTLCAGKIDSDGNWQSTGACAGVTTNIKVELSDSDLGNAMLGNKTSGNNMPANTNGSTGVIEASTPIPEDADNPIADEAIAKKVPESSTDRNKDTIQTVTTQKTKKTIDGNGLINTVTTTNTTVTNLTSGGTSSSGSSNTSTSNPNSSTTVTNSDASTTTTTTSASSDGSNITITTTKTTTTTDPTTGQTSSSTTSTAVSTPSTVSTTTTSIRQTDGSTGQTTTTTSSTQTPTMPNSTTTVTNPNGTKQTTSTTTTNNPTTKQNTTTTTTTNSSPTGTTETTSKTQTTPDTPPIVKHSGDGSSLELPPFCTWAKVVCDFIDWVEQPPKPQTPEPVDHEDLSNQLPEKPAINFNGICPPPVLFTFDFPFKTFTWSYEWTNLCDSLVKIKPWILAIANLMAVFIVLNSRKEIA